MSFIDHITGFLFDEKKRLSSKAAVVVFIIIAFFVLDNILGFSYYYNIDNKIEKIIKINLIISDSVTDESTKIFVTKLRTDIINKEDIITKSLSFLQNIKWSYGSDSYSSKSKVIPKNETAEVLVPRNNYWFHISSGGFYYLLALLIIPVIIFTDKTTSLLQRIATGFIASIVVASIGVLIYWLCGFIPQISNSLWIWNYILNFIIQILFSAIFYSFNQRKKQSV